MRYFDKIDLINDLIDENLDYEKHLKKISREDVLRNINKKKSKIPLTRTFKITEEMMEEKNWKKLPNDIKNELLEIHYNIKKIKINTKQINRLLELKNKYPEVPAILNYLANGYLITKDHSKHFYYIQETQQKFPDYLFGKIALADYYRNKDEIGKILSAFDNHYEIYTLVPREDNIYHISEIRGFYLNIGFYYTFKKKIDSSLLCYLLLKELDPDHQSTRLLGKNIYLNELKKIYNQMKRNINRK